jgi:RNA polymerase sigma-70 factor (ECF subfamily)
MESLSLDADERLIREACEAGDVARATTAALRRYGPELLGFLVGVHADYDTASEAFALFSEKLWKSLPRFEWKCSLRSWCYRLARNAACDIRRGDRRMPKVGLSSAPEVMELATRVRTETLSILRTANRTALERLRDELPEEDRCLLVLRVDRELEWREIAIVLAETANRADRIEDEAALKREAARLRKRFQIVTERLRALARERKLL